MYNQVIASKAFSAFDGVVIHDIEYGIEDHVIFSHECNGQRDGKPHRGRIYYNASGKPFLCIIAAVSISGIILECK